MTFRNADTIDEDAVIETDICIVGAGAAGIALALELEKSRFRVMLLESGDTEPREAADELNNMEIIGHPFNVKAQVRRRCLGGTTIATYGRSVLLDHIDFETRPWVTDSGWPIDEAQFRPFYPQTAHILGLKRTELLYSKCWADHPVSQTFTKNDLAIRIHRWGRHIDLGRAWGSRLRSSEKVEVLLRATALECQAGADGNQIRQLAARGLNGGRFTVRARAFVLACGGFENPRLLLLSRQGASPPKINWYPVGRYYMSHPRSQKLARLQLNPRHPRLSESVRTLVLHRDRKARGRLQFAFSPSEELQRKEQLLNVSGFFFAVSDAKSLAAKQSLARFSQKEATGRKPFLLSLGSLGRHLPTLASGAAHQLMLKPFRPNHLVMVDQCEQPPDPESRVMLGQDRDRFGSPLGRLDWRIDPATTASLRRLHGLLFAAFSRQNLGRFESRLLDEPDLVPDYQDCAHPTGTTRMSLDDRTGVVDTQCRVHGLQNLYVTGSSVFPVGGQANPTFAIIALAVRLASHLRDVLPEAIRPM